MKTFEVLGTGCTKCSKTAEAIEHAARENGQEVKVVKVTDPARIMEYQVMSTPAVAMDGKLVHAGSVPHREQVLSWLNQ